MDQMMDPRALEAILSALPYVADAAEHAGQTVGEGAGEAVGAALVNAAFGKLKGVLHKKSGGDDKVAKSVDELVANPGSEGRRLTLAEELNAADVDEDPEVKAAARELLDAVRAQPGGERHVANVMTASGNYIAQAGPGGTARVWVNRPEGREG
jgi:hypothetical protein